VVSRYNHCPIPSPSSLTRVVNDGELAVGLFNLELGGCRLDAERVVICSVDHHCNDQNG